ncbi:MAG: NAD-glutamate dehydrogenase [Rickettsiales bacterium]|jgi:glutamate dehydrogenase|nr:NAD-glutamate dehydrogenase [Rickettsiales bacterium]
MKIAYKQQHESALESILSALSKQDSGSFRQFVRRFYERTAVSDLEAMQPKAAVAIARGALDFMKNRKAGETKIRLFTPEIKQHGYASKHLVVELVGDDMPFLIDSLSAELMRHGLTVYETLHPMFLVLRDKKGEFLGLAEAGDNQAKQESFIHFDVSALPAGLSEKELLADLQWVLSHIRASVKDWRDIITNAEQIIASLGDTVGRFGKQDVAEVKDFLSWLVDRNFVFLGYGDYDLADSKGKALNSSNPVKLLGISTITEENNLQTIEQMLASNHLMEITKSSRRSPVHRPVPMDYIGVKRIGSDGKTIGEHRFLGLFTSNVYYQSTDDIPFLRRKVASVLARSGFAPMSHDGKALRTILEFLPRDEIFQMDEDELFDVSMGIFALESRPGVRIFARTDTFERFVSCMVFTPRERFSTDLREQIQTLIAKAYNGQVTNFSTQITEAPLARLHLMIKTTPGDIPSVDMKALEAEIAKRAYLWSDQLAEALLIKYGEDQGERYARTYGRAFSQSYINDHDAMSAAHDISNIEASLASSDLALELYQPKYEQASNLHLKIYNPNDQIALSDILPLLENAGFRVIEERPYEVRLSNSQVIWIRDFKLHITAPEYAPISEVRTFIEEALLKTWSREMEGDRFNSLVLLAGLSWKQVTLIRALAKYLRQAGFAQVRTSMEQALCLYPAIARQLVDLFDARFNPAGKDHAKQAEKQAQAIEAALSSVTNATHDLILRRYMELIQSILRTNYYQQARSVLSFKFDSKRVPDLPKPRPHVEIFVYSPRVEGIHLRGGLVARGGLRWSDRPDDFRTEVLGLMKAQMVKNSVIVPVGSKGGFVVKRPPASRDAYQQEGVACYKMYLSGLLDLTDNIASGKIVPPKDLVRHDKDDPYLVVAADKGTASFSDIANSVSAEYGFWLGDAFASGGSVGYDHKEMAITARGGWISVVRHFAEMGVDIGKQEFTCIGIGDMSGDVFGNGMLLSDKIRLVAAFNHLHIFIDPAPDAKKSFAERSRLFHLPRSSWKDYDEKSISKGGGIYERSAKFIELSKEAQAALGASKAKFTPDELVRAVLLAPVDLLWNGGIGTYVKAEEESHEEVGDRANNSVRVNGRELRAKIIGEGGNLGFTQKGRIEYARAGGRINTDAIDNSAGVDCSDHEVNIKIAFSPLVASKALPISKRDTILRKMTDEVASLVLKDNILQTQAITLAEHQGAALLDAQQRLIHTLEKTGLLDRTIEFLPSDKQIGELRAAKKGLTRPEIAVLLSYSKMEIYQQLLASSLPDERYFISDLKRYFPGVMQKDFAEAIEKHRLKREIIATVMTNSLVNRAGITFYFDLMEETGAGARDVAAAYALARDSFGLRDIWNGIEALASSVPVSVQVSMHAAANHFIAAQAMWLLRNFPLPLSMDQISAHITPQIIEIQKLLGKMQSETLAREQEKIRLQLIASGVPEKLVLRIASLESMGSALDIITVADQLKKNVREVGPEFFEMGARLSLFWLKISAQKIAVSSHWEKLALQALISQLSDEHRRLVATAFKSGGAKAWGVKAQASLSHYDAFLTDLKSTDGFDAPRLMVALKHIRKLG